MSNCAKCGAELIGSRRFCATCGAPAVDLRAPVVASPPADPVNPFAATAAPHLSGGAASPASTRAPVVIDAPAEGGPDALPAVPPGGAPEAPSLVSPLAVSNVVSQHGAFDAVMAAHRAGAEPSARPEDLASAPTAAAPPAAPRTGGSRPQREGDAPAPKRHDRTHVMGAFGPGAPVPSRGSTPSTSRLVAAPASAVTAPSGSPAAAAGGPSSGRGSDAPSQSTGHPHAASAPGSPSAPPGSCGAPAASASGQPWPPRLQPPYSPAPPRALRSPSQPPPAPPAQAYAAPYPAPPTPHAPSGAMAPQAWSGWSAASPPHHAAPQPPASPHGYGGFGYSPGARVVVLWSTGQRYPATIQQVSGSQCLVVFPDGQHRWVEMRYVAPA